jgi:CRP/FNR family transcriptional regulator, cyclic AMP receptor protein
MRRVLYILGQLTDQDADWLAGVGARRRLRVGDVLVRGGAVLDALYIILEGELSVRIDDDFEIARVGVGDMIGEMSFVDDSPASASVRATGEVMVLAVPRAAIADRMAGDPAFAARFYKAIAVFLADRMRGVLSRFGYGNASTDAGELDRQVMDTLHLAGGRFERLLQRLMG